MAHSAYPTDSDILTFVTNAGIVLPSNYNFINYGNLASQMWEQQTGYVPFLQNSSPVTRYFDPPGDRPNNRSFANFQYGGARTILLGAALINIDAIASVTQTGVTTLVPWKDYFLYPKNAEANKRPYTAIQFTVPFWGLQGSCQISAQWGVQAVLSEDVWQGILRLGASVAMYDVQENMEQGLILYKQGDTTSQFSDQNIAKLGETWQKEAQRLMQPYMNNFAGLLN